ncbi:hypothetical protein N9L71_11740 [Verrucomicrobiales bacterium]|nr:hypothetical protein [Verrucomicrobiales bacterium]
MNFIFFILLLFLAGFAAGFLILLGLTACTALLHPFLKRENPSKSALFINFFFSSYFWGLWACFCVGLTMKFTQKPEVTWDWLYWFFGFVWCASQVEWMSRGAEFTSDSTEEALSIMRMKARYVLVCVAAFLIFAFAPNLTKWPYGWFINGTGLAKHMHYEVTEGDEKETVINSEVLAFRKSITLRNEAMSQFENEYDLTKIRKSDIESATRLLNQSLEESNSVSERTLTLFDEELPFQYREKFLKGISLFREGINAKDDDMLVEGQNLMNEFGDFYTKMNRQKVEPFH